MRDLFELGDFTLHSGAKSEWRINEEALSDKSIEAAAYLLSKRLPPFEECYGIPKGGIRLMRVMRTLSKEDKGHGTLLIVDDVLTTGWSMHVKRQELLISHSSKRIVGAVIFARGPCAGWITPLWNLKETP